ncbi:NACHT domain-containing protein [Streptomyces sp. S3(2020)]|uniref:NACHT domain-containing protein n=1 Tax=Streptomyces sp. S3(2020) TaxID=2732044 RepID=UPI00148854EA|nr:NACHT domain-containing protein [Streptomyces sp. S3(2020)]NNN34427.1 NACHT domain-containing protein [Streptomyces sp. S3(2020)]
MAGLGGRRQRRKWQAIGALGALAIMASAAYVIRQLMHGGLEPSDTAGLLGLPLGVAGLVVAVVALRKPIEGNDAELARGWAATLAQQVEAGESGVWRQLLGDDTRRINLAYTLHPAAVRPAMAPGAGRLITDGSGPVTLPDIVTYYRATQPLRLVVTGAAGAGKTVLALELMLALIDGRAEDDPVPVRIPLSRWDTDRQSLPELLQQRLVEAYDWPTALAAGLVQHGLVLPVLDGLDERAPPAPDRSPDPAAPRATTVVQALNAYQQGRDAGPLILTCRTHHYDALTPHTEVLDAARITIAPVDATDAHTYLTDRALRAARWQPLTDHLAAHPGGLLATVLSTPWRLCLTATVYHRDGDPAELLTLPDADTLDQHLLTRYIPAATHTAPNPRGYTPEDVHRWLHHLTTYLAPASTTPAGAEATDLVLHELWPLAGRTRVRTTDALLTFLVVLTPLPLAWTPSQLPAGASALLGFTAVIAGGLATTTPSPKSPGNPFKDPYLRIRLAIGLSCSLLLGLLAGLTSGLVAGLTTGLTMGLAMGLLPGLVQRPGTSLGARAVLRRDALTGLVLGLVSGLATGLILGPWLGFVLGPWFGPWLGLVIGLWLACGLGIGAEASRRYVVFLLCSRRRLPFRLGVFLDWAVTAGLMRYSGPAYQYRHRELQHWLRQHPQPPDLP